MSKNDKGKQDTSVGRRDFLRGVAVGAGAAGLAAAGTLESAPAGAKEQPAAPGYRETEHVRLYYKLARF